MKPSQVASKLRQIAAAIDNSKNPRADLVARDLKRIIVSVGGDPTFTYPSGKTSPSPYDNEAKPPADAAAAAATHEWQQVPAGTIDSDGHMANAYTYECTQCGLEYRGHQAEPTPDKFPNMSPCNMGNW
jgi:hypothetical protein